MDVLSKMTGAHGTVCLHELLYIRYRIRLSASHVDAFNQFLRVLIETLLVPLHGGRLAEFLPRLKQTALKSVQMLLHVRKHARHFGKQIC